MKVLPQGVITGWAPLLCLLPLAVIPMNLWLVGARWTDWLAVGMTLAVFLPCYFMAFWAKPPLVYIPLATVLALGALTPIYAITCVYFAYAASLAGLVLPNREAVTFIIAVIAVVIAESLYFGQVRETIQGYKTQGLRAELGALRKTLDEAGISSEVEVVIGELPPRLENAASLLLKESVTNVIRHAGVSRCRIALETDGDRLHIRVQDNGRGGLVREGPGLTGMRERVEALALNEGTVRNYISESISKLGAINRVDAARIARNKGWL